MFTDRCVTSCATQPRYPQATCDHHASSRRRRPVQILRHIRHLSRRLRHLLSLLLLALSSSLPSRIITTLRLNKLPHNLDRRSWPSSLNSKNLAILSDDENSPLSSLGRLFEPNGFDQTRARVAEEGVRQLLLGFEGGV